LPHSDIHGSTPARGSPWLFAACHVLHRLLVPRHPPNALLILDIPAWAVRSKPHHAQKPSSGRDIDTWRCRYKDGIWKYCVFRTQHDFLPMAISTHCSRNPLKDPSGKIVHRASEPSLSNRWGVIHSTRANNNSRSDKSAEQRDARSIRRQTSHHTRPETHQNLIHSNKEQHDRSTGTADTNGATTPPGRFAQAHDQTEFEHPRYRPKSASWLNLLVPRRRRLSWFASKPLPP
jgi:hypothetical protein